MANKQNELTKEVAAPAGLKKLIEQCQKLYPDQPNPLQVTTVLKYWLGGHDPLDYISMYFNKGNQSKNIPPHWHYISFGLSDLHGDGRVHLAESMNNDEVLSGMGFELTFRLIAKESNSACLSRPPTWPANLLQSLARYCFQTGNRLCAGDNIPWRKALDGSSSKIQHMLITDDVQLMKTETPFGLVDFYQIIGVTDEELEQASRWNGNGVIDLLKRDPSTGGDWLVTDMERSKSVFELFPETLCQLADDLEKDGSDLAGINAEFTFKELYTRKFKTELDSKSLNEKCQLEDNNRDNSSIHPENFLSTMSVSTSLQKSCPINHQPIPTNVTPLDGIEITLAPYASKFVMLAIKDRVRHGRHFTFKSQNLALTFVAESVTGSIVSKEYPYCLLGYWIQVLITEDLIPRMMETFKNNIDCTDNFTGRKEFNWPDKHLKIIIDDPGHKNIGLYISINALQLLYDEIQSYSPPIKQTKKGFLKFITQKKFSLRGNIPKGLYVYGSVGGGKTTLMDLFFECCGSVTRKKRILFNSFMTNVHTRNHEVKQKMKRETQTGENKSKPFDPTAPVD